MNDKILEKINREFLELDKRYNHMREQLDNLTIEIDKFISKLTAKKLSKITGKEEDAILENFSKHFGMEYSSVIFSLIQRISYCIAKKLFEIKKNKEV